MGKYTDGEYTAEGLYAGKKSIIVKVGLANDAIKHVEVTPNTPNIKLSFNLQKRFAAAVPEEVVGKPIDEVHLDRLAGSSLTTKGFNEALAKIKAEAAK
jgi:uncharacterized protein with FMN-binding domain